MIILYFLLFIRFIRALYGMIMRILYDYYYEISVSLGNARLFTFLYLS